MVLLALFPVLDSSTPHSTQSGEPDVTVIRSARRTRSAQARFVAGNRIEVRIPAHFSAKQEHEVVADLVAKLKARRNPQALSPQELAVRAQELNEKFLEGQATFSEVKWVTNQQHRWASCTPGTGVIRLSHRLQVVPDYVLNAVIVHELAHTFVRGGHTPEFWQWANRAPQAERAAGYLEAYQRFGGTAG